MISPRIFRAAGLILLFLSLTLLTFAALMGDLEFHLVFIVPVISGTGPVSAMGGVMLLLGVLLFFYSLFPGPRIELEDDPDRHETVSSDGGTGRKGRWGGVILIGPIPIVMGSDWRTVLWVVVLAIVVLMALALFLLL